jgi:hypothetical protein
MDAQDLVVQAGAMLTKLINEHGPDRFKFIAVIIDRQANEKNQMVAAMSNSPAPEQALIGILRAVADMREKGLGSRSTNVVN